MRKYLKTISDDCVNLGIALVLVLATPVLVYGSLYILIYLSLTLERLIEPGVMGQMMFTILMWLGSLLMISLGYWIGGFFIIGLLPVWVSISAPGGRAAMFGWLHRAFYNYTPDWVLWLVLKLEADSRKERRQQFLEDVRKLSKE